MPSKIHIDTSFIFYFVVLLQIPTVTIAQSNIDYAEINNGVLRVGISAEGTLFRNMSNLCYGQFGYAGDSLSLAFCSNLWLNGKINNEDRLAANTYFEFSGSDFYFGPVADVYDSAFTNRYNRVWVVTKSQIDFHRQNYMVPGYSMENAISSWPAHGVSSNGEASILAPFYDVDANGNYNPEAGDYPIIKGDVTAFFMFNDDGAHNSSQGEKLGVEIHGMAYMYDTIDDNLASSLFLSYKIFNRNTLDISDFKLGFWTDFDLGNPIDDLIGCDSVKNIVYTYNADLDDDGPLGYGLNPPATGFIFLSEPIYGSINYKSVGVLGGWQLDLSDPLIPKDYINYMDQKWKNDSPLLLELPNGDGYTFSGSEYPRTHYHYNSSAMWSQNPVIQDNRNITVTANRYLGSEEFHCFEMAFSVARNTDSVSLFGSLDKLVNRMDTVRMHYNNLGQRCSEAFVNVAENKKQSFIVYPNPTSQDLYILYDKDLTIIEVEILDVQGKVVGYYQSDFDKLDVRSFEKGLYALRIKCKNQEVSVYKFLKH